MPSSETLVEPGRNEAGYDTLELRTAKESDMASVWEIPE
jgi:hypothetical protein